MSSYFIGTAPFCDPDGSQCEETPGYIDSGESKCGNGSCCWTGAKRKCTFDTNKWKQSEVYNEIIREQGVKDTDIIPSYNWFGKAPLCNANPCDLLNAGYIPIKTSSCGGGSCCTTGDKWLGMKPITKEHKKFYQQANKECWQMKQLKEQTLQEGIKLGSNLLNTVSKFAP